MSKQYKPREGGSKVIEPPKPQKQEKQ